MSLKGFSGLGFAFNNLIAGGGNSDVTIGTPTCVHGVSGYANLYSGAQDVVCRNLAINSSLAPTYSNGSRCSSYKIFASGTVTIGSSGIIRVDGGLPNGGGSPTDSGGKGYQYPFETPAPFTPPYHTGPLVGTLGGSGTGGASSSGGTGSPGYPGITSEQILFWGGAGGNGAGSPGGSGGFAIPQPNWNGWFEPIVYQQGMFYTNLAAETGTDYQYALFPTRINGGCGGGGSSHEGTPSVGGGGAGGGVCWLSCPKLVINTSGAAIAADGQAGTTGGGGGGGVIIIVTSKIVWGNISAVITAQGGGGANSGGAGRIFVFSNELVGMFSGTLNKATYDAAVLAYNS